MTVVRHMNLVYSLFVYLSYVTPACGNIIFHESIGLAPANEQNAIYAARESIARTAATSEDEDWDDDDFLLNVAVDLVETQEKQQLLLGRSL